MVIPSNGYYFSTYSAWVPIQPSRKCDIDRVQVTVTGVTTQAQIIEWLDNAWQIQRDRPTAIRSVRSQTLKLLNEKLKEWSDSQVRLAHQRYLPMSASSRQVGFSVLSYKMCKDRWKFETTWLCLPSIRLQLQKISYALQSRTKYILHTPNKKHFPSLNCVLVLTCNHEWLSIKIIFSFNLWRKKERVFNHDIYEHSGGKFT